MKLLTDIPLNERNGYGSYTPRTYIARLAPTCFELGDSPVVRELKVDGELADLKRLILARIASIESAEWDLQATEVHELDHEEDVACSS